ncbi:MAG: hypothetical protein KBS76_07760 [Ruminococcus sp.]|nr:hypothetical protein [Candidatus Apopatosoma intestinale]
MKRKWFRVLPLIAGFILLSQMSILCAASPAHMEKSEILASEAYKLGLSEEQFAALVEHAHLVRPDLSVTGFEVLAVRGTDVRAAKKIYRILLRDYEWAPCDPAERAVFLRCGNGVFRVKGSEEEVDAFISHMSKKGKVVKRLLINNN